MTVLDMGCGPGFFTIEIANLLNGSPTFGPGMRKIPITGGTRTTKWKARWLLICRRHSPTTG